MSSEDNTAKLAQLRNEFGQNGGLAEDVLVSVLEMMGGSVQLTIEFLRAGQDDYVDEAGEKGERLPKGYMDKPKGWSLEKLQERKHKTAARQMKDFLTGEGTLKEHLDALAESPELYTAVMALLLEYNVEFSAGTCSRALAAAWAHGKFELSELMLSKELLFQLPEVLRAVRMLDAPRRVKALQKRVAMLEAQGTAKPHTLTVIRNAFLQEKSTMFEGQTTSVTGALARRIKRWIKRIPKGKLEFFALQMPKESWRQLADIVHPSPKDFQLPYFLSICFDEPAPVGSVVRSCADLNANNVEELSAAFPLPYSYLRYRVPDLPKSVKQRVATYEKLDTLIWWYEEIGGDVLDDIINQRLDKGEEPGFSYGKFMERLLLFKGLDVPFYSKLIPIAEKRLKQILLPLDPPALVLGDASFSMDVAIRTSTILASLLCALARADLQFFNESVVRPSVVPTTVAEVLQITQETKADKLTAPAVALQELIKTEQVVKFFVVVTDEIENEPSGGEFFAQAFYRYYTEVYPADICFVSFLDTPTKGRMVTALESLGIVPLQFRLAASRPDLTKTDSLLGLLSAYSPSFSDTVEEMVTLIKNKAPLDAVLSKVLSRNAGPEAEAPLTVASSSFSSASSSTASSHGPEFESPADEL